MYMITCQHKPTKTTGILFLKNEDAPLPEFDKAWRAANAKLLVDLTLPDEMIGTLLVSKEGYSAVESFAFDMLWGEVEEIVTDEDLDGLLQAELTDPDIWGPEKQSSADVFMDEVNKLFGDD